MTGRGRAAKARVITVGMGAAVAKAEPTTAAVAGGEGEITALAGEDWTVDTGTMIGERMGGEVGMTGETTGDQAAGVIEVTGGETWAEEPAMVWDEVGRQRFLRGHKHKKRVGVVTVHDRAPDRDRPRVKESGVVAVVIGIQTIGTKRKRAMGSFRQTQRSS